MMEVSVSTPDLKLPAWFKRNCCPKCGGGPCYITCPPAPQLRQFVCSRCGIALDFKSGESIKAVYRDWLKGQGKGVA